MFILKKGHQPGVYVPLRALFLVLHNYEQCAGHMTIYSLFPLYCRVQSQLDSKELPGSVRSLLGLCGIEFSL